MTDVPKISNTKVQQLMQDYPKGLVLLSSWLVANGYSYELQQRYRKNGWLRLIGKGAMLKLDDPFLLSGALAALQTQANMNIHYGEMSSLFIVVQQLICFTSICLEYRLILILLILQRAKAEMPI